MLKKFLPNKQIKHFTDVSASFLKKENKNGVIVDLDNTLVPWNIAHATDEVIHWLTELQNNDIKVTIFSNNNEERVRIFAEPLHIPFIAKANKPLKGGFKRAKKALLLQDDEIVVIGDQLLTDVFGGNRSNLYTILVDPLVTSDARITTFNRKIERMILNRFYKKGKLRRRDST